MEAATNLEKYVAETLAVQIRPKLWAESQDLPLFISGQFSFLESRFLDGQCLFAVHKGRETITPGTVRKHFDWLADRYPYLLIYVSDIISSYDRKRLIQNKIAFIVPGRQMYLPPLGIDLREHIRTKSRKSLDTLSPSAQYFFLYALYHKLDEISSRDFSEATDYSKMTISRAFSELKDHNILQSYKEGRLEVHKFNQKKQNIWESNMEMFVSPVTKRYWIQTSHLWEDSVDSGMTALAEYTMLSPPSYRTVAVDRRIWKAWNDIDPLVVIPREEPGALQVELWRYDPHTLYEGPLADPLSLYLTYRGDPDERIQTACARLLEAVPW
jgi:DNA-binding transcriptional ArsR family regulator